jgi:hypothetical protein
MMRSGRGGCVMISIANASLRWAGDRVRVVAGDPVLGPHESGQPISGLTDALAAGWLAVTDGLPVAAVHAALLGLDRYREFYAEPPPRTG